MVSCGTFFTVCIDHEGFIWLFGENSSGQLGTGNKTKFNVPQKLHNIPPVHSVSCGSDHTLIITNDSNLWLCGRNYDGQLCNGDKVSIFRYIFSRNRFAIFHHLGRQIFQSRQKCKEMIQLVFAYYKVIFLSKRINYTLSHTNQYE